MATAISTSVVGWDRLVDQLLSRSPSHSLELAAYTLESSSAGCGTLGVAGNSACVAVRGVAIHL